MTKPVTPVTLFSGWLKSPLLEALLERLRASDGFGFGENDPATPVTPVTGDFDGVGRGLCDINLFVKPVICVICFSGWLKSPLF
jgi:hypothetical protein